MNKDSEFVVLVLDNGQLDRLVTVNMLDLKAYTLLQARDIQDVLTLLRSPQRIDLLITDVRMPRHTNGEEIVKRAREIRPELKALLITGNQDDLREDWESREGTQVISKPFRLDAFLQAVSSLLSAPPKADSSTQQ